MRRFNLKAALPLISAILYIALVIVHSVSIFEFDYSLFKFEFKNNAKSQLETRKFISSPNRKPAFASDLKSAIPSKLQKNLPHRKANPSLKEIFDNQPYSRTEQIKELLNSKSPQFNWQVEAVGEFGFKAALGEILSDQNENTTSKVALQIAEIINIPGDQLELTPKTFAETNLSRTQIFQQKYNNLEIRGAELRLSVANHNNAIFYISGNFFPIREYQIHRNWTNDELELKLTDQYHQPEWQIMSSQRDEFLWPKKDAVAEIAHSYIIRRSQPFEEKEIIISAVSGEILWIKDGVIKN